MNRLHRSRKNKVILGVCGGLAEYFNIDPTLIRIICILISFSGVGIFLYIVAALIMPEDKGYTGSDQWGGCCGTGTGSYSNAGPGSYTGAGNNAGTGTDTGAGAGPKADPGFDTSFESEFNSGADEWGRPAKYHPEKNKFVLGAILVGLGILFLGKQIMPGLFELKFMIPLLLIGIGGIIVFKGRN
jgi:phage shock protein C